MTSHAKISSNVIITLASCPWGPAPAHRVGLLSKMYVICIKFLGPRVLGSTILTLQTWTN